MGPQFALRDQYLGRSHEPPAPVEVLPRGRILQLLTHPKRLAPDRVHVGADAHDLRSGAFVGEERSVPASRAVRRQRLGARSSRVGTRDQVPREPQLVLGEFSNLSSNLVW